MGDEKIVDRSAVCDRKDGREAGRENGLSIRCVVLFQSGSLHVVHSRSVADYRVALRRKGMTKCP